MYAGLLGHLGSFLYKIWEKSETKNFLADNGLRKQTSTLRARLDCPGFDTKIKPDRDSWGPCAMCNTELQKKRAVVAKKIVRQINIRGASGMKYGELMEQEERKWKSCPVDRQRWCQAYKKSSWETNIRTNRQTNKQSSTLV